MKAPHLSVLRALLIQQCEVRLVKLTEELAPFDFVEAFGLSITSSWGNGHATTYRALINALEQRGHRITFLERNVPWYRDHRDLDEPGGWSLKLYNSLHDIPRCFGKQIATADLVIIGSYVPDGIAVIDWVTCHARGVTAFYDIDTPETLAKLDNGLDYISATLIPRFDIYLSFSGGPGARDDRRWLWQPDGAPVVLQRRPFALPATTGRNQMVAGLSRHVQRGPSAVS
jgi:hypothetical protein